MAVYPYGGYQMGYPMYSQPVPDQLTQLRQNQQYQPQPMPQPAAQPGNGIVWVQGEDAAKAYMVAPGSTVLLMDSEGERFYLKSSDASGMPLPLRVFEYVERTGAKPTIAAPPIPLEEYVTRQEFEAWAADFEARATAKEPVRESAKPKAKKEE